jgi:hypothetical protein
VSKDAPPFLVRTPVKVDTAAIAVQLSILKTEREKQKPKREPKVFKAKLP